MTNDWSVSGNTAAAYANLIFHRVRDGMLINDWTVDWEREPLTHSFYPDAEVTQFRLPNSDSSVVNGTPDCSAAHIADLLHLTYGLVSQRLTINRNDRAGVYEKAPWAKWGRNTASGGGRYCVDFYLVESGEENRGEPGLTPLPAGIHHYSPLRHAFELISNEDATDELARVQGYPNVAERYLVMTINFWRSGFKYNDFAYQATAMDIGTAMATIAELEGTVTRGTWDLWTNDSAVAEILGLDFLRDGVYAIQAWGETRALWPLGEAGARPATAQKDTTEPVVATPTAVQPSVARPTSRRVTSKYPEVVDFATTRAMQQDVADFPGRPAPFGTLRPVLPRRVREPKDGTAATLMERQSSFGRFTGDAYPWESLLALLRHGDSIGTQICVAGVKWMYLVYVSAVDGLMPGLYRYEPATGQLELVSAERQEDFLASTYFLNNYDGRRAAATIIPCVNVMELCESWGVRGYRMANAVVGALCQAISTEAVRQNLGTGVALGFDAARHSEHAGLRETEMTPLLMIMTGVDDPLAGRFHSSSGARLAEIHE